VKHPDATALTAGFAVINPFMEEAFWRGLVLDKTAHWPTWLRVVYTSAMFAASHPAIWGVHSRANRTPEVVLSTFTMGVAWSISAIYTKSLWWSVLAHFIVDLANMAVFTFLNYYDPPSFIDALGIRR